MSWYLSFIVLHLYQYLSMLFCSTLFTFHAYFVLSHYIYYVLSYIYITYLYTPF